MGLSGRVPRRVNAAAKAGLLDVVDRAAVEGWPVARACRYLELSTRRCERWRARATTGSLDDKAPGGNPVHGITPTEEAEIVAVFNGWAAVDRSHRKLAHRGSWLERFWVDPSTVKRVLQRHDLRFVALHGRATRNASCGRTGSRNGPTVCGSTTQHTGPDRRRRPP